MMAMMIQPMVSSITAVATMIWPTLRRMKFISRTTTATIFTDEIDSAVPRNSDATSRASGCGSRLSGRNCPSAKPQMNGTTIPAIEIVMAALPTLPHQLEVGLHAGEQQQQQDAELRHAVDHGLLFGSRRKDRALRLRPQPAEQRRPEQQAAEQFADHRWLADPLHDLAEPAADGDQQHDLDDEDEFGRFCGFFTGGFGHGDHEQKATANAQQLDRSSPHRIPKPLPAGARLSKFRTSGTRSLRKVPDLPAAGRVPLHAYLQAAIGPKGNPEHDRRCESDPAFS